MRDVAAIVEPAFDAERAAREIALAHVALQDCERKLDAIENQAHSIMRKAEGLREEQARRRVEIGRLLVEARRVIKHGGWLPYLAKIGIDQQRASEWMRLAGHVESKLPTSPNVGDLNNAPTLADAGIDKRPRKSTRADEQPDLPAAQRPTPSFNIDGELAALRTKLCSFAKSAPAEARAQIAEELRRVASLIDEMNH